MIGSNAINVTNNKCLILALPINSNNMLVAPVRRAVERLAGAINAHISTTGVITGRNPDLKSFMVY
jgi:hypothetical protein